MTLTIPTSDLVGCVADALNFISPDREDVERRVVHLRWDGALFHASATDSIRVAVSSWSPDDPPEQDEQHELGVELGSDDGPWEFLLSSDDATHLVKTAKPVKGLEHVPLYVEYDGEVLGVKRAKQSRVPGFTLSYDAQPYVFPDLRKFVVDAMANAEPVKEIALSMALLKGFAEVRQRGAAARWTFAGTERPAVVEIGNRFIGAIQPARAGE